VADCPWSLSRGEDSVVELVSVVQVQVALRCHREAALVQTAQRLRAARLALRLARRRAVHLLQPSQYAAARRRGKRECCGCVLVSSFGLQLQQLSEVHIAYAARGFWVCRQPGQECEAVPWSHAERCAIPYQLQGDVGRGPARLGEGAQRTTSRKRRLLGVCGHVGEQLSWQVEETSRLVCRRGEIANARAKRSETGRAKGLQGLDYGKRKLGKHLGLHLSAFGCRGYG
jgi:hypothetical protein